MKYYLLLDAKNRMLDWNKSKKVIEDSVPLYTKHIQEQGPFPNVRLPLRTGRGGLQ